MQADEWLKYVLPSKSSFWMFLIPLVLVAGVASVIVYMVRRHRRLSNSFSRFANTHYDTKTGATRIGNDPIDDHDHNMHDVPRFDDDEPLVLT